MRDQALTVMFMAFIVLALVGVGGAMYTVDETQQAVITQFGEPIGAPITKAGLYYKIPFVQTANYFEKRILQWDGDPNQIPTRDKRYIWVDTTARWRIIDALKFMQSVRTLESAQGRLDDIIDSATRDIISDNNLVEAVRDTNRLLANPEKEFLDEVEIEVGKVSFEKIDVGRDALSRKILERAKQLMPGFGIELIDVRIKRINYVQEVQNKVYERMISERKRVAEQFRSEGQGKKAEIEGQMTKELQEIQSEAYRKSEELKGVADAKAIKIYADAYNKDPEFYAFTKSLESYRDSITSQTTLMLSTENEFYKNITGTGLSIKTP